VVSGVLFDSSHYLNRNKIGVETVVFISSFVCCLCTNCVASDLFELTVVGLRWSYFIRRQWSEVFWFFCVTTWLPNFVSIRCSSTFNEIQGQ
jgi:hypothetical protein